ncbi:hypothetical protein EYF80_029843 [Liparis tanakae]|uniref:Uncharacterized protein n=1 Tax=Liparis tanakae TaxID=230148 RepID=A0A4Z2H2D8_9TELE|nr:hypothetical protein EYF80_029843 [Liparis tanakae]
MRKTPDNKSLLLGVEQRLAGCQSPGGNERQSQQTAAVACRQRADVEGNRSSLRLHRRDVRRYAVMQFIVRRPSRQIHAEWETFKGKLMWITVQRCDV